MDGWVGVISVLRIAIMDGWVGVISVLRIARMDEWGVMPVLRIVVDGWIDEGGGHSGKKLAILCNSLHPALYSDFRTIWY